MDMTPKAYQEYVKAKAPKSPIVRDCLRAFLVGGLICALGQAIQNGWLAAGLTKDDAGAATACCLVLFSAVLTGLNLYNNIGRFGGAGSLIPITGFANSVVSPAIDFKAENWVNGVGAKMFTVAGPVIVYGVSASVIYGIILVILQSF